MRRGFGFGPAMARRHGATGPSEPSNLFVAATDGGLDNYGNWDGDAYELETGRPDPFGEDLAFRLYANGPSAFYQGFNGPTKIPVASLGLNDGRAIHFGAWVRNINTPQGTRLRFYSATGGSTSWLFEVWPNFASATSTTISSVSMGANTARQNGAVFHEALGGGWNKVWATMDLAGAGAWNDWDLRLMPWRGSNLGTEEIEYVCPFLGEGATPPATPQHRRWVENRLAESHDFSDPSWANSRLSQGASIPGPLSRDAQYWVGDGSSTGDGSFRAMTFTAADDNVLSCYVKDDGSAANYFKISLYDQDAATHRQVRWLFDESGVPAFFDGGNVAAYGSEPAGGGFYRLWIHLDGLADGIVGHGLRVYLYPTANAQVSGGKFIDGAQLEQFPRRTVPGVFVDGLETGSLI